MNNLTKKEFDIIKNTRVQIVIFEDNKRVLTYGGINYQTAIEDIMSQNLIGRDVLVFPYPFILNGKENTLTLWNKSEIEELYQQYKKERAL